MVNNDDACYYERLLCYEEDKRNMLKEHPEYTAEQRDGLTKMLADKWQV